MIMMVWCFTSLSTLFNLSRWNTDSELSAACSRRPHATQEEGLHEQAQWYSTCRQNKPEIQLTLVISNSKGLSEILRDICTSTYQICRIEEKLIWLTTFNKYMCNLIPEVRDILKILWKREENFASFPQYFLHVVRFLMFRQGPDFHFEISGYSR